MIKRISAYVNIAIEDYDESVLNHVVELMKDSLREQVLDVILEDKWEIEENRRTLFRNREGVWESHQIEDGREIKDSLEVMTVIVQGEVLSDSNM
ncbi:hypothetical protein [Desulfosporosinus hippei]|uniref:Uncharacterized protein n=1 Tax=Desulfosporosinus hippei DSM 8344 TaxID=1121419 RepID=A0A1G8A908_9FIRM|nr:hypothetical protein [Desulfosporosinus hippei]SDH17357.1 hypothetical protein SAMN05443529_110139 [Desulfosporosinus hippei DSM 8344]